MNPTPKTEARPIIELINVDIVSPQDPTSLTLTGVNWTVCEGDFWILGGLQGVGKSALLYTAAGLSKAAGGTLRLFGEEILPTYSESSLATRMRLGLVFADGGRIFRHLSLRQNIELPLLYHERMNVADVNAFSHQLIDAVDIRAIASRRPSELSPAWTMRAALARAMALKPEVLLLDNPLANMDPMHTRWWMDMLEQLARGHELMDGRPMTLVVTANDLSPWQQTGRKVALIENNGLYVCRNAFDGNAPDAARLEPLFTTHLRRTTP